MPTPSSATVNTIIPCSRQQLTLDGPAGLREADGIGQEIVKHLAHAALVGDEGRDIVGDGDVDREAARTAAFADAQDRCIDDGAHVDGG